MVSLHKRIRPLAALAICAAAAIPATAANYVPPANQLTINVKDRGAKGDGVSDDAPAIRSALVQLEQAGGGTLKVPAGTYLLNSYVSSPHPWFFYNLRVGSNTLIQGDPGAKFLQGPGGRAPGPADATQVRNTVLAVGSPNYIIASFQNTSYNGGYYNLNPTSAGGTTVTLTSSGDAGRFAAGDYVAIYSSTSGDVIPSEPTQVAAVQGATLTLTRPLARSFQQAYIANVAKLATVNVAVQNISVQGAEPLAVMETFNFTAEDCQFISDMSIGAKNTWGVNVNTMRDFRFSRDLISSVGPSYGSVELPQRNSQDGVIEDSTFQVGYLVFGEYAAHWRLTGNHIWTYTQPGASAAVSIGGLDVTFANNDVHGSGVVPLLADFSGLDDYTSYVGQIAITGNTFTCRADNSNCLMLRSTDPVVTNNVITTTGNAIGIKLEGALPTAAAIQKNSIQIDQGFGIVVNTPVKDQSSFVANTITGKTGYGIFVATPSTPNTGGHVIAGNIITGFNQAVMIDMNAHPGTIVSSTVGGTCSAR
jgi:hypothetical protein